MWVEMLEESSGIIISEVESTCRCTFSGEWIEEGKPAICLLMREWDVEKEKPVDSWDSAVPLSISSCKKLKQALEQFDFEEADSNENLAPTFFVWYRTVKVDSACCLVCEEHVSQGSQAVSFSDHRMDKWRNLVWCHVDCIPRFCEGIENVVNYVDENSGEIVSKTL